MYNEVLRCKKWFHTFLYIHLHSPSNEHVILIHRRKSITSAISKPVMFVISRSKQTHLFISLLTCQIRAWWQATSFQIWTRKVGLSPGLEARYIPWESDATSAATTQAPLFRPLSTCEFGSRCSDVGAPITRHRWPEIEVGCREPTGGPQGQRSFRIMWCFGTCHLNRCYMFTSLCISLFYWYRRKWPIRFTCLTIFDFPRMLFRELYLL